MKIFYTLLSGLLIFSSAVSAKEDIDNEAPLFKENKGQLTDQDHKLRPDIHYYGNSDGLSYFFKNTGISYQLYEKSKKDDELLISRVDMTWLGANADANVITKNFSTATDNFYNTAQKDGITGVRSFGDLQYKNIYQGIDLHYYYRNGSLKYDFIVAPGNDYKVIQIKVEGATSITHSKDGSISITTPNGTITEAMPVAFQGEKEIKTTWVLDNDILSFQVADYDHTLPLTIDPLVYQWKRSVGGSAFQYTVVTSFDRSQSDTYGHVYVAGGRLDPIDGNYSSLRKYDAGGNLIWYKSLYNYYTSLIHNISIRGVSVFGNNIYASGWVDNINLATNGAYQTTIAGQYDGFLLKYDSSGTKLWGTYYGGTAYDASNGCKVDSAENIFICGTTESANMASITAYQNTKSGLTDAFIAKFTANGSRIWSTYYGGNNKDNAESIDVRGNRIYMAGTTTSTSGIALTGAHQPALSGNINAFLLCMDTSGVPQWSTYYGADTTYSGQCAVNGTAVYVTGYTNATSNIATAGTHQPANAGGTDGFLAKFNLSGVRQWGTYYGGTNRDVAKGTSFGNDGRIYICGSTRSATGISTPGNYNTNYVANQYRPEMGSAYIAELDENGQRISGSYFNEGSVAEYCSSNNMGDVFISGVIAEDLSIDAFITKFSYCNMPEPVVTASSLNICANDSVLLSTAPVSGATYQWYRNDALITGATSNTYYATLAGNYKVILSNCPSGVSLTVTLTSSPLPTTQIAKTNAQCAVATNGSITVTASGGTAPYTYAWDNSANTTPTHSGLTTGSYTVHTTDAKGCTRTNTVAILNANNNPLSLASHTNVPCYGGSLATITVTTTGGTAPYTYSWDNLTATTPYLDGLTTGTYVVHTTDSNNCSDVDTVLIVQNTTMPSSTPIASICAVTVDTITGKNVVMWKRSGIVKAIAYKIYREGSVTGQYDLIGTNNASDPGIFIDATSLPMQQSYSYKIAEIDSCNNEWPMSILHKTVHLSANVGTTGGVNLNWNIYEGKPYTTHRIMRSVNGEPFVLLNELSGTITAFTDVTPPAGVKVYVIQIDLGPVCNQGYSQFITSNTQSVGATGINNMPGANAVLIMPNPTTGVIHISGDVPGAVRLYDAVGRLLQEGKNINKLDISSYAKGIFMIRLYNRKGELYHNQKIVLQ